MGNVITIYILTEVITPAPILNIYRKRSAHHVKKQENTKLRTKTCQIINLRAKFVLISRFQSSYQMWSHCLNK